MSFFKKLSLALLVLSNLGTGYTLYKYWHQFRTVSFILFNHKEAIEIVDRKVVELQAAQYEWNRFHQGRYDSMLEAMQEVIQHLAEPPIVGDKEYYNMDWQMFAEPEKTPPEPTLPKE